MTVPKADRAGRCQFHRWLTVGTGTGLVWTEKCAACGRKRTIRHVKQDTKRKPLKQGRGFAASKAQREKVRDAVCVCCAAVPGPYTTIDPAHLCPRGRGGCDDPLCVVPLCRTSYGTGCHGEFDEGNIDLLPILEPRYRAEVAHCVMHMGLENARVRLAPSQYRTERAA